MTSFLTIFAWIVGVAYTIVFGFRIWVSFEEGRAIPVMSFMIAAACWAWIFSH